MVSAQSAPIIGILGGPTGSGKSTVAIEWAKAHPEIEIISADSVQVYRGADIGSDKVDAQTRRAIPHHSIDIMEPDVSYTAGDFVRHTTQAIADILARKRRPLIVGGTGFYLKALIYGMWDLPPVDSADKQRVRATLEALSTESLFEKLNEVDPTWAERVMQHDRYRLLRALEVWTLHKKRPSDLDLNAHSNADPRFALWVIDRPQDDLSLRLRARVQWMLDQGWQAEVETLRRQYPQSPLWRFAGYRQFASYLDGKRPPGRKPKPGTAGLVDEVVLAHEQLAKAQRTWFRSEPLSQFFTLDSQRNDLDATFARVYGQSLDDAPSR